MDNFIAYLGASYIRDLAVIWFCGSLLLGNFSLSVDLNVMQNLYSRLYNMITKSFLHTTAVAGSVRNSAMAKVFSKITNRNLTYLIINIHHSLKHVSEVSPLYKYKNLQGLRYFHFYKNFQTGLLNKKPELEYLVN